ncbi:MAG: sugar ABC transporter permease [Atribacterota bacterium]|nr:sugar ABC transporter permease [Candidatus Atribacteria bacterium]
MYRSEDTEPKKHRIRHWSYWKTGYILIAPVLFVLIIVNLYPSLYQIFISFMSYKLGSPISSFNGIANYQKLLTDVRFWNSLVITLKLLLYTLPVQLVLGIILAMLLDASRYHKYFLPLLVLPVVTTPVVVGYIFQYMFREDYGLISYFLRLLHLFPGYNLTANTGTVLPAIAMVDTWQWTPFVMIVLLAGLQSLPSSVYEAARVDGGSWWDIFLKITLPLLKSQILVVLLFRTVDVLRIFDTIFALTRGGPGTGSESLTIYLQLTGFRFRNLGYAGAMGMFLLVIASLFTTAFMKLAKSEGIEEEK